MKGPDRDAYNRSLIGHPSLCAHCGTVTAAMYPVDDPDCDCNCHRARAFDRAVRAAQGKNRAK